MQNPHAGAIAERRRTKPRVGRTESSRREIATRAPCKTRKN